MATAQQTIEVARSQIGYRESPAGSNRQKYGPAEPWCVDFINWVCDQVDVTLPTHTASVYVLLAAFEGIGRLYSSPQPGDIAFWSYGDGHAEFVVSSTATTVTDIGGNTSRLIDVGDQWDPYSGQPIMSNIPVAVRVHQASRPAGAGAR